MLKCNPSTERTITVTNNAYTRLAEANNDRTAITVSATSGDCWITTNPNANPATQLEGLFCSAQSNPHVFCRCHQGDWVKRALYVVNNTGVQTACVVEAFEEDA